MAQAHHSRCLKTRHPHVNMHLCQIFFQESTIVFKMQEGKLFIDIFQFYKLKATRKTVFLTVADFWEVSCLVQFLNNNLVFLSSRMCVFTFH